MLSHLWEGDGRMVKCSLEFMRVTLSIITSECVVNSSCCYYHLGSIEGMVLL
jgi:hypothetical protein